MIYQEGKKMTDCKLCKQRIERLALTCSKGTICSRCSKDISLAECQPAKSLDSVLWFLAETFFRRGAGEDVTFEKVWSEIENLPLIRLEHLFGKGGK